MMATAWFSCYRSKAAAEFGDLITLLQCKHKTISLSTYPDTTLKFACNKADIAYKQIAEGIDPSDNRKQTKIEQQTRIAEEKREASDLPAIDSFAHVAHEWFEGRKHTSISSHGAYTLLLLTLSMNFDLR